MTDLQSLPSPTTTTKILFGLLLSLVIPTTTDELYQASALPNQKVISAKRTDPPYDKDNCTDQSPYIFIGVLVGLGTGILVLWLLNCFNLPARETEERSIKTIA